MSDGLTQPGVRVDADLWEAFRNFVQEQNGAVNGYLANEFENALRAYMDTSHGGDTHDRLVEIEQELRELRTLVENEEQEKKDSDVSTTTERRLEDIRDTIDDETDGSPKVHEQVVELAIRKHAGGSDPTIRRYKELLLDDRELFQHPDNESLFFRDATDFVTATNALRKGGRITQETYDEVTEAYSEDWWLAQLPENDTDNDKRGFQ